MQASLNSELEKKIETVIPYILDTINGDSKLEINELIFDLLNMSPQILINLSQKNQTINQFCRTNTEFLNLLKEKLHNANQPDFEIKSIDAKENHSIFDLYIAAALMTDVNNVKNKDRAIHLNQACRLGLNDALIVRCKTNERIIKSPTALSENKNHAMDAIIQDCKQLANLYWGLGYIEAGCMLYALGKEILHNDKARGQFFIEQAVKNFLCAECLKDNEFSNKIINKFKSTKNFTSIFSDNNLTVDWESMRSRYVEWVGEKLSVLESEARHETSSILKTNLTPKPL